MPTEFDIKFIKSHFAEHLEEFVREERSEKSAVEWRCLYAELDPEIIRVPSRKNIATATLTSTFTNGADKAKAMWLTTGHLFILFQGPVRAIIRDYESFLDFISEGQRPEYHFFWQLNEMEGYFDQILAHVLQEEPSEEADLQDENLPEFFVSPDLLSRRMARYKPLLLIVEDDRSTRLFLQAIMEKYCDIAVAWDAKQAERFYRTMLPNIAFLDIELPDGDGQELAELFCSNDPDAYVVMVSGNLDSDVIQRCTNAGVRGWVSKPAKERELLELVDQYHKERQQRVASG